MLNTQISDIFDAMSTAIIVSNYKTNDVLFVSRFARDNLDIEGVPQSYKSYQLLLKDDYLINAYLAADLEDGNCLTKILPGFGRMTSPVVLHSVLFTDGGRLLRFDSVSPLVVDGDNSDSLYTALFEAAYLRIEASYHGIDLPEENIYDCLSASLDLYEADRAFVLELDEELEACQNLYSKTRTGFGTDEQAPDDTMLFSNLFTGIIKKGEPFMFTSEQLKSTHPAEHQWLREHRIFNAMAVPFTTRTGLVAFFGVNNVRRFWNKTSFLTLSTKALANEVRAIRMLQVKNAAKHSGTDLSDDDVVIKLFGGFEINTTAGSLDFTDLSSVQCGRFLLYLLKNRNRTIPVREIAEVLWPDQLIDNPYNMVKGVAFRVRKILDNICPSKYNLVVAKAGTYAINDKLTIILDTDSFDQLCDRVHSSKLTTMEKQQLYDKAIRLYKGDMLPNYESEIWLIGWVGYYQIKYLEMLKEYLALLAETEQYVKIFEVVSGVLSIGFTDGEIYEYLIDALVKQNKIELAKSYYTRIEKLLSPDSHRRYISIWNESRK